MFPEVFSHVGGAVWGPTRILFIFFASRYELWQHYDEKQDYIRQLKITN